MKVTISVLLLSVFSSTLWAMSTEQLIQNQVAADLNKINSAAAFKQANQNRGGFVSVGPDVTCNFNAGGSRIQDAIDSGATEIRVTNDDTYTENLSLNDIDVIIRGGYANCDDANDGALPAGLTTLDGSGMLAPIIDITGDSSRNNIVLENLFITNGQRGGINATSADVLVEINDSFIGSNSHNGQGGGISIFGGDTDIIASNVSINQNNALFGGGIACQGFQASVLIIGDSTMQNNSAIGPGSGTSSGGTGGAVFLAQACTFSLYSGSLSDESKAIASNHQKGLILPTFFSNTSNSFGGAISSINTSQVFLFGQQMCSNGQCLGDHATPVFIFENQSGFSPMGGQDGGAIRQTDDGNQAIMNGVFFNGNSAAGNGGAIHLSDGAELNISRAPGPCWHEIFCNAIFDSMSSTAVGLGGAIYNDEAVVDVSTTFFSENRADFGTVLYSTGTTATNRFEGVIFNDNGNNGADGFSDNHVLSAALGAAIEVIHSTFADNNAETSVFGIDVALGSSLNLQSSIVHDASSGTVMNLAAGTTNINCLMAHEQATVTGTNITVDNPEFIDPSNGEFGLNPEFSPAIDFCDDSQITLEHLDYNNEPRGWDDPSVVNVNGPFDLGADETYANDIIFENGFEL